MSILLCRPDEKHWCVECCKLRPCCYFGNLDDGKRGCLIYQKRPELCQNFNCVDSYFRMSQADAEEVRKIILAFPPGEFEVLTAVNIFQRQRFLQY